MKKLLPLIFMITCISIVIGLFAFLGSEGLTAGQLSVTKKYKLSEITAETGLPKFINESQFLNLINGKFYSNNIMNNSGIFDNILTKTENDMWVEDSIMEESVAPSANEPAFDSGTSTSGAIDDEDYSQTNVQVEGVDEGDILKTDGKYIYVLTNNYFKIVDVKEDKLICVYHLKDFNYISSMYLKNDQVIFIGTTSHVKPEKYNKKNDFGKPVEDVSETDYYYDYGYNYGNYRQYVCVSIFDISDKTSPKNIRTVEYEGNLLSSRESNGKLILVINKNFGYFYNAKPTVEDILPALIDSKYGTITPKISDIYKAPGEIEPNIMTIAILDIKNESKSETMSILGFGSNVYMNSKSLYIFGNDYDYNSSMTSIVKYSIENGIKYIGNNAVKGWTATQFAYDEYKDNFRIAVTYDNGYTQENGVFVFDKNMNKIGELTGLAKDERIYSVRYMGDTAYIVTFKQIDPLFVIDMTENNPKVLSELKVPGFSTYLHPVGDGLLLGIGTETKDLYSSDSWGSTNKVIGTTRIGLKVSLFDVSDRANPKEIDVSSLVGGENASSEAEYNHRAFVFNANKNIGYFPISVQNTNNKNYYSYVQGFTEIRIENGKLKTTVKAPQNYDEYDYYYGYQNRVCYAQNKLYLFQNERLVQFDIDTLEFIQTIELN